MQRTFSVDSTSVLFLPEGSGLSDPVLQGIPGGKPGGGQGDLGLSLPLLCLYWLGDAFF